MTRSPQTLYGRTLRATSTGLVVAAILLGGCRGDLSGRPPVHVNPNMDRQEKLDPQEAHVFFADGRAARPPVAGTVARGFLREDTRFHFGREADGSLVERLPVPVTRDLLARGQDRYEIFCAVCHGDVGDGQGIIMTGGYGYVPAPTYHSDLLRGVPDGHLYDVIAHGIRSMPGYAQQVPEADRWAIVAWIRALQRSQYAAEEDVPPGILSTMQTTGGGAQPQAPGS